MFRGQKKQGGWSKKTRSGGQKITRWEVRKTKLGGLKSLPIWFDSLPILPGSAAGAAALNPGAGPGAAARGIAGGLRW